MMARSCVELWEVLRKSASLYQQASQAVHQTAARLQQLERDASNGQARLNSLQAQKARLDSQVRRAEQAADEEDGDENTRRLQQLYQHQQELAEQIRRQVQALQKIRREQAQLHDHLKQIVPHLRAGVSQNAALGDEFRRGESRAGQAENRLDQLRSRTYGAGAAASAASAAGQKVSSYEEGARYAFRLSDQYALLLQQLTGLQSAAARQAVREEGRTFLQSLTEEQRQALYDYTTERPGEPTYRNINTALRYPHTHRFAPGNRERAVRMHAALSRASIPCNCTVYRGTSRDFLGKYKHLSNEELVGKVLPEWGFMSTSLNRKDSFGGDLKLVIDVPAGAPGAYIGSISSVGNMESEVLFDYGQMLRVTRAEQDATGQRILHLTMMK